jgi:hypothetical protein
MSATQTEAGTDIASEIIDAVQKGEQAALESVRRFVDTVDKAIPVPRDGDAESGRRKIVDSAFKMVEELVGTTNDFAKSIVNAAADALGEGKSAVGDSHEAT